MGMSEMVRGFLRGGISELVLKRNHRRNAILRAM